MSSSPVFSTYCSTIRQVQNARHMTVRPGMTLNSYAFMGGVSQIRNPEVEAETKIRAQSPTKSA